MTDAPQHDYLVKQAESLGAFLARLAGFSQQGASDEILRLIDHQRRQVLGLPDDFSDEDLENLWHTGRLDGSDWKNLARLCVFQSEQAAATPGEALRFLEKALRICVFFEEKTACYDFEIQLEKTKLLHQINLIESTQSLHT